MKFGPLRPACEGFVIRTKAIASQRLVRTSQRLVAASRSLTNHLSWSPPSLDVGSLAGHTFSRFDSYNLACLPYYCTNSSFVRKKYAIPESESCPTGCEDGCMALFCGCCSVAQMMRHTTEYETYRAECFSATGLPDHVPALIV